MTRELCAEHFAEYVEDYGDDGEAVLNEDNCFSMPAPSFRLHLCGLLWGRIDGRQ